MNDTETLSANKEVTLRRRKPRHTRRSVFWIDRLMTNGITFGGLAVIAAVLGIMVYLVIVVTPLFQGARMTATVNYSLMSSEETQKLLYAETDEYRDLGLYALATGEAVWFAAKNGRVISRQRLFAADMTPTSFSRSTGGHVAIGFADGTIGIGRVGFQTAFIPLQEATPDIRRLKSGECIKGRAGVVERTPTGELREVSPSITMDKPILVGSPHVPVQLLDYRVAEQNSRLAVLKKNGEMFVNEIVGRENMMTGETTHEISTTPVPFPPALRALGDPSFLLIASAGDQLYIAWADGTTVRYDLRDPEHPVLAEQIDLAPGSSSVRLTCLVFNNGEQSLLTSDSEGRTRAWFRLPSPSSRKTTDGFSLVLAHEMPKQNSSITAIAVSGRDKTFMTGTQDGRLQLFYLTSEKTLAETYTTPPAPIATVQITPKGDGAFAVGANGHATLLGLSNPHPQTTLGNIFGKVWYEGYPAAAFTWQSSSATDDFEPKFSLIPLIFGTLKATLYSMLFAVPIALLAAIYTSEFLDRRYRGPLKSTIEMMASLPSVVLGFMAALVLAPVVEKSVLAVLAVFGLIPVVILAFGYGWQILPPRIGLPLSGKPQLLILIALIVVTLMIAPSLGPVLGRLLFAGDFKGWLDGRVGTGASGIALLSWPVIFVAMLILDRRVLADHIQRRLGAISRTRTAALDLFKYLALTLLSIFLAWATAIILSRLGIDPRPSILGTYVQRNALITGFVMGFAVIPIIYTIAEDALSAVPQTLRSASLGCGATRWQTAIRVVMPVAIPGIFSALMVGLGRAVGETMIVLMAAGNTPVMDLNIFNGLRTLSANIAVELPEAVKDGTLYRILFLAALTLFGLTFIVNTIAEIVRQRFRWRTQQL